MTLAAASPAYPSDRDLWERLFAAIDARDASAFVGFLTPDAHFRFANSPMVIGSEAVRAAVAGFFGAIAGCRHQLLRTTSGAASQACEGLVTYTRHDGSAVTLPFGNVLEMRGDKVAAYRIYIDNTPLFEPQFEPLFAPPHATLVAPSAEQAVTASARASEVPAAGAGG
jgi:ketosteroid isomerase-like protein